MSKTLSMSPAAIRSRAYRAALKAQRAASGCLAAPETAAPVLAGPPVPPSRWLPAHVSLEQVPYPPLTTLEAETLAEQTATDGRKYRLNGFGDWVLSDPIPLSPMRPPLPIVERRTLAGIVTGWVFAIVAFFMPR